MPILLARINYEKHLLDSDGSYASPHRNMREADVALRKADFSPVGISMTAEKAEMKILLAFIGTDGKLWDEAPGPYISPHQRPEETDVALRKADFTFTRAFPISINDLPQ